MPLKKYLHDTVAHNPTERYLSLGEKCNKDLPYAVDKSLTPAEAQGKYNLPKKVRGNPLPCSCHVATLALVSKVQKDGWLYADYRCDHNWSNIFRFKIKQHKKAKPDKLSLAAANAYKPTELEEY